MKTLMLLSKFYYYTNIVFIGRQDMYKRGVQRIIWQKKVKISLKSTNFPENAHIISRVDSKKRI